MEDRQRLAQPWILAGIICGILADVAYFAAVALDMPLRVGYPVFWVFGPLLVVAAGGIYAFVSFRRTTFALQLGTIFMMIAGAMVTLMATMQGVLRSEMKAIQPGSESDPAWGAWQLAFRAGDSLQLGADLAWDMYIFSAMALLGYAMIRDPRLGRIIGISGIVIGVVGIAFNFYTWPANPGTAGLVDVGPLSGIWFLVVTIWIIRHYKSLNNTLSQQG